MKNNLLIGAIISGVIALAVSLSVVSMNKSQPLGSVASPEVMSPWFTYGGVRNWAAHTESLTVATTTVCALQSPAATSTLVFASITFKVSSTTASTITVAKATTAYATTTVLNTSSLGANAQGTLIVASSTAGVDGNAVFSPNNYLVVGMAGGIGTFSPTGTCQAEWVQNSY